MRKFSRRIIALFLAAAMAFSTPLSTAAETDDQINTQERSSEVSSEENSDSEDASLISDIDGAEESSQDSLEESENDVTENSDVEAADQSVSESSEKPEEEIASEFEDELIENTDEETEDPAEEEESDEIDVKDEEDDEDDDEPEPPSHDVYTEDYFLYFGDEGDTDNMAVIKEDAAIIKDTADYQITENNGLYRINGVPSVLAGLTDEQLSKIPVISFMGSYDETQMVIHNTGSGEKMPVPLAKNSDGTYILRYVYDDQNNVTGIEFGINTDAFLDELFDEIYYDGSDRVANSSYTKEYNDENLKGTVNLEYDHDISLKFFSATFVKIEITLTSHCNYDLTVLGDNDFTSEIGSDSPSISIGGSIDFNYGLKIKTGGKGHVSGSFTTVSHASFGTNGYKDSWEVKDRDVTDYTPEENSHLYLSIDPTIKYNSNFGIIKVFGIKIGPIAKVSMNYAIGEESLGEWDTEKDDSILHMCNERGTKAGCVKGTYNDEMTMTGSASISILVKTWKWEGLADQQVSDDIQFYHSLEYDESGDGICPHKFANAALKADKEEGVYNADSISVGLSALDTKGNIAEGFTIEYIVDAGYEGTDEEYKEYSEPITLERNTDSSSGLTTKTITARLKHSDDVIEEKTYTYVLTDSDFRVIPEQLTLNRYESGKIMTLSAGENGQEITYTSDKDGLTFSNKTTYVNGYESIDVQGSEIGEYKVTVKCGDKEKVCTVTISDDLGNITAKTGSGMYILKELSVTGFGDYKDNNQDLDVTYPYAYHNGTHCIAEELSYSGTENVEIHYTTDGTEPTRYSPVYNGKIYLSADNSIMEGVGIRQVKAVAYEPETGKLGEVSSFTYVIVESLPSYGEAFTIMIPTEEHIGALGMVVAAYIPSLSDIMDPDCWISIGGDEEKGEEPTMCFKVKWHWSSSDWLTVPVLGTNEWITEPTIHMDFVQVGLLFGLSTTGDDPVIIKATAKSNNSNSSDTKYIKKTASCKVYVDDDAETEYTIKYNTNGGTGSFPDQTKKRGTSITLSSNKPTKTGYTFEGWSLSRYSASADYQPGDTFRRDEDTTLYAVWKKSENSFLVTYDANGGTGAPASQEKKKGVELKLSTQMPSRNGYDFQGWSEYKDDESVQYEAGGTYTLDKDVTLYAKWKKHEETYKIEYDLNGGKNGPQAQEKIHGIDLKLSEVVPVRTGYIFQYWREITEYREERYNPGDTYYSDRNTVLRAIWKQDMSYYVITYDANGGENAPEDQLISRGQTGNVSSRVPVRAGFKFLYWTDESGNVYYPGVEIEPYQNMTLTAVWKQNTNCCVVSYDANGGYHAPSSQEKKKGTALTLSSEKPDRNGYSFLGWSAGKDSLSAEYQPGDVYSKDESITLYAVWKAETEQYTITYDANGGQNAPESQIKSKGVDIRITTEQPIRAGYEFLGWSPDKYATTADFIPGSSYYCDDKDLYLYAVWSRSEDTYIIHFDDNGGTGGPGDVEKKKGENLSLRLATPTRADAKGKTYRFLGWSEDKYASVPEYTISDSYKKDQNATLYAVYRTDPDVVQVSYDANGGTGAPVSQVMNLGQTIKLSTQLPVRNGYTFIGWSLKKDNVPDYQPGEDYFSLADTVLYAAWKQTDNTSILTYDANGGEGAPESQSAVTGKSVLISSTVPVRAGYNFLGWSDQAAGTTAQYHAGNELVLDENRTVYAVWEHKTEKYVVSYDAAGGENAPEAQEKQKGVTLILSEFVPVRAGYDFKGWEVDRGSGRVAFQPKDEYTYDADVTLYAVWEKTAGSYIVTYDANGGTGAPQPQSKKENVTLTLSGKRPVRTGYDFVGWADTPDAAKKQYGPEDDYTRNEDVTLYAVWEKLPEYVVITYDANGGHDAPSPTAFNPEEGSAKLSNHIPVREGYTFVAWAEKQDGSGKRYAPGADFSGTSDITLYAVWQKNEEQYTVTYDANGGSNAPAVQIKTKGKTLVLSTEVPMRESYTFAGWAETPDAEAAQYAAGSDYTLDKNITLYAVWKYQGIYRKLTVINGTTSHGTKEYYIRAGYDASVIADTPEAGKKFGTWLVTEGDLTLTKEQKSSANMTFVMPDCDVTIQAEFMYIPVESHSISVINGTANGYENTTLYAGTKVKAAAYPAGSMLFDHWEAEGIELTSEQRISSVFEFYMPDNDVTLKAVYTQHSIVPHSLDVSRGTIKNESDKGKTHADYYEGQEVTVIANSAGGLVFEGWEAYGIELTEEQLKDPELAFIMPDNDVMVVANYKSAVIEPRELYVVRGTIDDPDGSTSYDPIYNYVSGSYYSGSTVKVSAYKSVLLAFDYWEAYGIELTEEQKKSEDLTLAIPDEDVLLIAHYTSEAILPNKLTVENGSFTVSGEKRTEADFFEGSVIHVTADPAAGMIFDHWDVEGATLTDEQKTSAEIDFDMPGNDVTLTAVYKAAPTPSPTTTPTPSPTNTPTPSPTNTPTPSPTNTPTPVPTNTPTPGPTNTPTPVPTNTPTLTPVPTQTPVPTGDTSGTGSYTVLLAAACIAAMAMVIILRRKRRK